MFGLFPSCFGPVVSLTSMHTTFFLLFYSFLQEFFYVFDCLVTGIVCVISLFQFDIDLLFDVVIIS